MSSAASLGWLLSFDHPAALSAVLLLTIVPARRYGSATTRALAMALALMITLRLAAWLAYGSSLAIHTFCALLSLAITVPIAVRSRRTYPLVLAGAMLLSALAYSVSLLVSGAPSLAALNIAALANAVLVTAFWFGLGQDYRRAKLRQRLSYAQSQGN